MLHFCYFCKQTLLKPTEVEYQQTVPALIPTFALNNILQNLTVVTVYII